MHSSRGCTHPGLLTQLLEERVEGDHCAATDALAELALRHAAPLGRDSAPDGDTGKGSCRLPCKSFLASISETMSIASLFILLSRVWSSWSLFTLRLTRSCAFATSKRSRKNRVPCRASLTTLSARVNRLSGMPNASATSVTLRAVPGCFCRMQA